MAFNSLTLFINKGSGLEDFFDILESKISHIIKYKKGSKDVNDLKFTLDSLSYDMGMYQSDHFVAVLSSTSLDRNNVSLQKLRECLVGAKASVKQGETTISTNLFVYKATPKWTSNQTVKVTLDIYSADKLMDLQKYSQAFTSKRLGEDVIKAKTPVFSSKGENGTPVINVTAQISPRIMSYDRMDSSDNNVKKCELIQPYMVQYNETFRSFINRTTNRSGEFLYWNEGKLQYGLDTKETDDDKYTDIATIADEISESNADTNGFLTQPVTAEHRDGSSGVGFAGKEKSMTYDLEVGTPDYNAKVKFAPGAKMAYGGEPFRSAWYNSTKKGKDGESIVDPCRVGLDLVFSYASSGGLKEFVTDFLNKVAVDNPLRELNKMKGKDEGKKKTNNCPLEDKKYDKYSKEEQTNFGIKGMSTPDEKKELYHFSTAPAAMKEDETRLDGSKFLSQAFYAKVRELGTKAEKNALDFTLAQNAELVHIGQIVTFDENKYIITHIDGSFISDPNNAGMPMLCMKVHAIPVTVRGKNSYYLPAPLPEQVRVMDGNSTAIITDTNDPYGQGRVRVRFTWQSPLNIELTADEENKCVYEAYKEAYNSQIKKNVTKKDGENDEDYQTRFCKEGGNQYNNDEEHASLYVISNDIMTNIADIENTPDEIDKIKKQISKLEKEMDEVEKDIKKCTDSDSDKKKKKALEKRNKVLDFDLAARKTDLKKAEAKLQNAKIKYPNNKTKYRQACENLKNSKNCTPNPPQDKSELKEEKKLWKEEHKINAEYYNRRKLFDDTKKELIDAAIDKKRSTQECHDSTPWIRMTSPMAGRVNKFYMTPTTKTEVLIGFENGNPERPYVIGQLFNKTNGGGGNYSIIGNNEEGMIISDENVGWDDIANMAGLPIMKTVTSTVPGIISASSIKVGDKMPMGGKIQFKDKFGFYDVSMSSKDRKVSIKSALGDITLSAFTGISISAPNGDVKINGKNVIITAGDKIQLKSGTNKDIMDSTTKDITGFISGLVSKMAISAGTSLISRKAVDLSLLRSFWEVIFRPLNGTLQVKSCRHLLLEAGGGTAEIPVDAFKVQDPRAAIAAFPNYPYYLLQELVQYINDGMTDSNGAMTKAMAAVKAAIAACRKDNNVIDVEDSPKAADYVNEKDKVDAVETLSMAKMEHIIQNCVKKDDGIWKVKDDTDTLLKFCPIPDPKEDPNKIEFIYEYDRDKWLKLVKAVAGKVANLGNAFEKAQMKTELNGKFVKAINFGKKSKHLIAIKDIKQDDFNEILEPLTKVKYGTLSEYTIWASKPGANLAANQGSMKPEPFIGKTEFEISTFIGNAASLENYSNHYCFNKFNDADKKHVCWGILKLLHQVGIIVHIAASEEIKDKKKQYVVDDAFPGWDNNNNMPVGYGPTSALKLTWNDFLNHCVTAGSVEKKGAKGVRSIISNTLIDKAQDLADNYIDWKDWNWMFLQERNLWDANASKGMILMSSGKGKGTLKVKDDGAIDKASNTSFDTMKDKMSDNSLTKPMGTMTKEEKEAHDHALSKKFTHRSNLKLQNLK